MRGFGNGPQPARLGHVGTGRHGIGPEQDGSSTITGDRGEAELRRTPRSTPSTRESNIRSCSLVPGSGGASSQEPDSHVARCSCRRPWDGPYPMGSRPAVGLGLPPPGARTEPQAERGLFGDVEVRVDVLHVVEFFERLDQVRACFASPPSTGMVDCGTIEISARTPRRPRLQRVADVSERDRIADDVPALGVAQVSAPPSRASSRPLLVGRPVLLDHRRPCV